MFSSVYSNLKYLISIDCYFKIIFVNNFAYYFILH